MGWRSEMYAKHPRLATGVSVFAVGGALAVLLAGVGQREWRKMGLRGDAVRACIAAGEPRVTCELKVSEFHRECTMLAGVAVRRTIELDGARYLECVRQSPEAYREMLRARR